MENLLVGFPPFTSNPFFISVNNLTRVKRTPLLFLRQVASADSVLPNKKLNYLALPNQEVFWRVCLSYRIARCSVLYGASYLRKSRSILGLRKRSHRNTRPRGPRFLFRPFYTTELNSSLFKFEKNVSFIIFQIKSTNSTLFVTHPPSPALRHLKSLRDGGEGVRSMENLLVGFPPFTSNPFFISVNNLTRVKRTPLLFLRQVASADSVLPNKKMELFGSAKSRVFFEGFI